MNTLMPSWKIAVLLSYISIASASAAIITPALPIIQSTMHISSGQLNWVVSLFLIGYMLGQILYAPLANRFGRLASLRVGFAINFIGIAICLAAGYSKNYELLLIGRLITALGASAGLACTFMLLNESLDHDRAKHALSYAAVSFTAGIGLAVLIGGIVTTYFTWIDCFWILLLHGLLMLGSTYWFSETLTKATPMSFKTIAHGYCTAFRSKTLISFSLCLGCVAVFSYCYSAAAPLIADHLFGLTPSAYGYWNILNMLGMLAGAFYAAKTLKKHDNKRVLLITIITSILLMALMALLYQLQILFTLCFFAISTAMYFIASIIFPAASHIASNAIEDKASASSSMNFINMGSAVVSVAIMGYLPITHLWAMLLTVTAFMALSLLVWRIAH